MSYKTPFWWSTGPLADKQILSLCNNHQMIWPYSNTLRNIKGGPSFGLSSYGYDVRLSDEFKIFNKNYHDVIDIAYPDEEAFTDVTLGSEKEDLVIPPYGFVLGRTIETFSMPRDVICLCVAKSTYARIGLIVGVTPIEPGFKGTITLELSNTLSTPISVKAGHGICQFIFIKGSTPCNISYSDRRGKYQHQKNVTIAKVAK